MSEMLETFTDENWEQEVVGSPTPVLVDFWADWCQPCKVLVPVLEAVAGQYTGRLRVGKINVDENSSVPERYAIRALPTLLIIKGGTVAEQRTGLVSKETLTKLIDPQLG